MTSDEFFAANKSSFDLIFIDGLHHRDQVERDILNALAVLNPGGTIVVHDCNPGDESMQVVPQSQEEWTGDVWKAWVKLRATRFDLRMFVVDVDYGCGVIRRRKPDTMRTRGDMPYAVFDKNRRDLLNLIDVSDFLRCLGEPER
ncbi:MAG: class I SAM-dependent methyltransferase [Candidatus Aminicenantes bacterium]|nr:class I SAM-dependent methyltransferase [Candidatus Aminicenantes bacterium]